MQSSLPCTNMKLVIVPLLTLLSAVLGREIGNDISRDPIQLKNISMIFGWKTVGYPFH